MLGRNRLGKVHFAKWPIGGANRLEVVDGEELIVAVLFTKIETGTKRAKTMQKEMLTNRASLQVASCCGHFK